MPLDLTLQRVDDDLAQGRVLPAIQRLRSLVRTYPDRLDVRARLAVVYRSQHEIAQAGRWSFLAEDADATEIAAFERAFRSPRGRLAAVAWSGDTDALGPVASARLARLQEGARSPDDAVDERTRSERVLERAGCTAAGLVAGAIALLAILGLGALVVQGVRVVAGWF
ncbi:DUF6584 family protein [Isoptericola sp. NPDC057559]|uniref:DUF6584 family protein n=1 Tax=Isoptericola sp. NPDC057559 TaxID=3346168 RepID=UPI0036AEA37D